MNKSEHDKLCGDLIVDFANAKTSEEAVLNFLTNVQKVFKFPTEFASKAQIKYLELKGSLKLLSPSEIELFNLFVNEINSIKSLEQYSGRLSFQGYNDDLENYRYGENRSIYFDISDIPLDSEEDNSVDINLGKSHKQNRKKLENLFYEYHSDSHLSEDQLEIMSADFADAILKHIEIGDMMLEILHVKKSVSIERYREIEKITYDCYSFFQQEPRHIDKIRMELQSYLKSMMRNKSEGKIILRGFVYLYNGIFNLDVSEDGNIEEQTSFAEPEIFLNRNFESLHFSYSNFSCRCIYHQIIAYCLVKFLQNEKYKKKIKKCPYCEMFFIAKDTKRKHSCYSNDCIRKW